MNTDKTKIMRFRKEGEEKVKGNGDGKRRGLKR